MEEGLLWSFVSKLNLFYQFHTMTFNVPKYARNVLAHPTLIAYVMLADLIVIYGYLDTTTVLGLLSITYSFRRHIMWVIWSKSGGILHVHQTARPLLDHLLTTD